MSDLITDTEPRRDKIPQTHTAGPWEWFGDGCGGVYLATPNRGRLIILDAWKDGKAKPRLRFARRTDGMGGLLHPVGPEDASTFPDARLIASAPDLLSSLRAIVAEDDRLRTAGDCVTSMGDLIEAARVAVAKAEGKS